MLANVPLFPLHAVLFPDGIMPLRIFEARYLDMISESLRTGSGFGISLIREGAEVGGPAACHDIGTLARIIDWQRGEDGVLEITVHGEGRFRILRTRLRKNRLLEGDIEFINGEEDRELPVEYQLLADLLRQIAEKFSLTYLSDEEKFMQAGWVGCRLAELLPVDMGDKQILLEMNDPIRRLEQVQSILQTISMDQFAM